MYRFGNFGMLLLFWTLGGVLTSPSVAGTKSVYSEVQIGVESVVLISETSPNFDRH